MAYLETFLYIEKEGKPLSKLIHVIKQSFPMCEHYFISGGGEGKALRETR